MKSVRILAIVLLALMAVSCSFDRERRHRGRSNDDADAREDVIEAGEDAGDDAEDMPDGSMDATDDVVPDVLPDAVPDAGGDADADAEPDVPPAPCVDEDDDGYPIDDGTCVAEQYDCDDSDPLVNPGVDAEASVLALGDLLVDGTVCEADPASRRDLCYQNLCDDVAAGTEEGIDNDCDGLANELDPDCGDADGDGVPDAIDAVFPADMALGDGKADALCSVPSRIDPSWDYSGGAWAFGLPMSSLGGFDEIPAEPVPGVVTTLDHGAFELEAICLDLWPMLQGGQPSGLHDWVSGEAACPLDRLDHKGYCVSTGDGWCRGLGVLDACDGRVDDQPSWQRIANDEAIEP